MNESVLPIRALTAALALLLAGLALGPAQAQGRNSRNGDYIAAVVNQELVTAGEVARRIESARAEAARAGQRLPPEGELRQQVMDLLIDERVIITTARESGVRIDEPDIDRAVQNVAAQNQITPQVLRQRLAADGIEYSRFRAQLRDQLMMERLREREVYRRIQISDEELDKFMAEQRKASQGEAETNIAQILVPVPEGTTPEAEARLRERALAALKRVQGGEDFAVVALDVSADANREKGGALGLRPASRLPDAFVNATRSVEAGQVAPELLRTGAGFHVLKVLERREAGEPRATQTRARHVLLRPSAQLTAEVASRRLADYRRQIETGQRNFEDIARQYSEDGSAAAGGDLGWSGPGTMVPEFEEAMNALPVGGLSAPVPSRFGVHLIQVLERREVAIDPKAQREQARNVLREQRFDQAFLEWTKEIRSRAYVELREPPP